MDIFKKKNKEENGFEFRADNNIWRFLFNKTGIIAGESRNLKDKTTSYFSLNYKENKIYFKDVQLDEKWWASIEFITDNVIYISKFNKPDMPDQKGIIAIDALSGKKLWDNTELAFIFSDDENTYGYRQLFETRKIYKINNENGGLAQELNESMSEDLIQKKEDYNEGLFANCIYPEQYNPEHMNETEVLNTIKNLEQNKEIDGFIEYVVYENLLIYNLHEKNVIGFDNILKIYSRSKSKIIYEDILNHKIASYAPDSFFIKDNYLIYIKNKNTLVIHNLYNFENIN